jgi:hypothetical protein
VDNLARVVERQRNLEEEEEDGGPLLTDVRFPSRDTSPSQNSPTRKDSDKSDGSQDDDTPLPPPPPEGVKGVESKEAKDAAAAKDS